MHPAVVTTVLMLVGILNTVTAQPHHEEDQFKCDESDEVVSCGDGWSRMDENHCTKFFQIPKSFDDAEEHCLSLHSELASVQTPDQMVKTICMTMHDNPGLHPFWIGAKRSEDWFTHADGSDVEFDQWYPGQPDNIDGHENCIELNYKELGYRNDANCSDENYFMCAKAM